MKKLYVLVVIVVVLSALLSACGGSNVKTGAPITTPSMPASAQNVVDQMHKAVTTCSNAGDAVAVLTDCVDAVANVGQ
jgi:major membrane immunogen (membrane-anchored lipoprotein)